MRSQPPPLLTPTNANFTRRLFVVPSEPQVASKAADKPTAAARSAIRRHRTVRGPHARLQALEARRRRILSAAAPTSPRPEDYEVWMTERTSSPNDGEATSAAHLREHAHRILESGQTRFDRQNPHTRPSNTDMDGPLPPVPESRDYSAIEDQQQRLRRISRRLAARNLAPTPPYTEADYTLPRVRSRSRSPRPSTLTPTLSPSRQSDGDITPRRLLRDTEIMLTTGRRPILRNHVSTVSLC